MAWTKPSKTPSLLERSRILTIDDKQILAGESEDSVLIGQEYISYWTSQSKSVSTATNKSKIPSDLQRTRILLDNGSQILAGASEDKVLIGQDDVDIWGKSTKTLPHTESVRILTSDGRQIVAGSTEVMILVSELENSYWNNNLKTTGSWTKKAKSI